MSEVTKLTDIELVTKYANTKDKKYFAEVYDRYFKDVYRVIYSRCGNKEVAEDVVSDTFFALIDLLKNYNAQSSLKTFVIGIGINKLKQHYYKNSNNVTFPDEFIEEFDNGAIDDIDESGLSEVECTKLKDCVASLDSPYKEVLQNRFFDLKSIKETAELLNLSSANVRVVQHRAIDKLKNILVQDDFNK